MSGRRRRGAPGFGLVVALITLAVTAILAAAAAAAMKVLLRDSLYQQRLLQAQMIAESGAEAALARLAQDGTWRAGLRGELGGGAYEVALDSGPRPSVTATGRSPLLLPFGRARRTVRFTAEALPIPQLLHGVMAEELVALAGFCRIDGYDSEKDPRPWRFEKTGHVLTNGGFSVHSFGSQVLGDAVYKTGAPPPGLVSGEVTRSLTPSRLPAQDGSRYAFANDNLSGLSPASVYDPARRSVRVASTTAATIESGVYYFRELKVEGSLSVRITDGPVVIFLEGPLTGSLRNGTSIPANLILYGQGERSAWTLRGGWPFHGVIAAPQHDVVITQEIFGAVAGRTVSLTPGFLHFDRSLSRPPGFAVRVRPLSWRSGPGG